MTKPVTCIWRVPSATTPCVCTVQSVVWIVVIVTVPVVSSTVHRTTANPHLDVVHGGTSLSSSSSYSFSSVWISQAFSTSSPSTSSFQSSSSSSTLRLSSSSLSPSSFSSPTAKAINVTMPLAPPTCRDRGGVFPLHTFRLWTCGFCLHYLYATADPAVNIRFNPQYKVLLLINGSGHIADVVPPDVDETSHVEKVCEALTQARQDCQRWLSCCHAAAACCHRQLAKHPGYNMTPANEAEGLALSCPATWDGFGCWEDTPSGRVVAAPCPAYILHASTEAKVHKVCGVHGTWYVHPESGLEWTNYTGCDAPTRHKFHAILWVDVGCRGFSLVLLIPACFLFLYFRSLRNQHHCRLHTCLFVSYIMVNVLWILWEVILFRDRLESSEHHSILYQNPVGCRVLHALMKYSLICTFMWMCLEGLHLYRLLVNAFAVPASLTGYYLTGFGFPMFPALMYTSVRISKDNLNTWCWMYKADDFEWMIHAPIIVCLAVNVYFLVRILHALVTQLQTHPNEPSRFRRAVKATVMLVPLLGLQAVVAIYNPQWEATAGAFYFFNKIVFNTQGGVVAIAFCFFNGETLTVIRNALPRSSRSGSLQRTTEQRATAATQFTTSNSSVPGKKSPLSGRSMASFRKTTGQSNDSGQREQQCYVAVRSVGDDPQAQREGGEDVGEDLKEGAEDRV